MQERVQIESTKWHKGKGRPTFSSRRTPTGTWLPSSHWLGSKGEESNPSSSASDASLTCGEEEEWMMDIFHWFIHRPMRLTTRMLRIQTWVSYKVEWGLLHKTDGQGRPHSRFGTEGLLQNKKEGKTGSYTDRTEVKGLCRVSKKERSPLKTTEADSSLSTSFLPVVDCYAMVSTGQRQFQSCVHTQERDHHPSFSRVGKKQGVWIQTLHSQPSSLSASCSKSYL